MRGKVGENEIVTANTEVGISDMRPLICELRGQPVMLDRDLMAIYALDQVHQLGEEGADRDRRLSRRGESGHVCEARARREGGYV